MHLAIDREKDLLRNIQSFLTVSQNAKRKVEHHGVVLLEQAVKGLFFVGPNSF